MTMFAWQVDFERPLWFAVLVALPLWIVYWRRSMVRLSPLRKLLSISIRALMLASIAAGLAGPTLTGPTNEKSVYGLWGGSSRAVPAPIEIIARDNVRAGEPFTIDLLERSESSGTANLNVLQGSQPLPQEKMTLVAGENHKSIPLIADKPSHVKSYTVRVSGDDVIEMLHTQDALAACPIYVDPPRRVLVVGSQPALAEHLRQALMGEHMEVDVRPDLPGTAEALGDFDLIILSVMCRRTQSPRHKPRHCKTTFVRAAA